MMSQVWDKTELYSHFHLQPLQSIWLAMNDTSYVFAPQKGFLYYLFFLYFFASLLSSYFACTYQNKMYVVDVVVVVHQSFCCLNFFAWYSLQYFLFQSYLFCLALLNDRVGFQYDVYFIVNLVSFVLPIGKTIFPFPIFFLPFFSRLFC